MSSSFESKLEQIEQAIRDELKNKQELGRAAKTFAIMGGICLAAVVVVKAPIFLLATVAMATGYGVTSWLRSKSEARLDAQYQQQASLLIAQDAARKGPDAPSQHLAPDMTADAGIKNGFAQKANASTPERQADSAADRQAGAAPDRVEQLAETVEDLRQKIDGKPAELDKSKTTFKGLRRDK